MTGAEPGLSGDGVRVVKLPPVVDVANAMDVRAELAGMLVDGVTVLVADMAATTTLTLEGLQVLVLVRSAARGKGAQLRLASIQPPVRRFMGLAGADQLFRLYESVELARAVAGDESLR